MPQQKKMSSSTGKFNFQTGKLVESISLITRWRVEFWDHIGSLLPLSNPRRSISGSILCNTNDASGMLDNQTGKSHWFKSVHVRWIVYLYATIYHVGFNWSFFALIYIDGWGFFKKDLLYSTSASYRVKNEINTQALGGHEPTTFDH